ncbi:hypothetical protein DSY3107 [Desulfitobacterium hafniense Y51]|uniref:Uncharacterized protein n=2 Tax=Desulfitobacterium hafniense TaxID=49338 RepID=Q24SU6_DESHY|nr:hypothetical protein DSY3107 [Desulfitobacterium hafniense Y51]
METSCFQPFSAACFSRSFVSARLNSLPIRKAKSLGCFAGLSGEAVVGNAGEEACLSGFFRLYRCRLSGRVGDLEKAPGRSRES